MAGTADSDLSISELKAEIERLSRELDQASSEKIQSAQLGLVLLEEKSALQLRCDELETLYENTKHELDITQEALMKLDTTQKVTTQSGIEQENALLNESAAMESSLTLQIIELEGETKQLRHELERVVSERDRLLAESSELGADKATRESERVALRAELREARQREQRLIVDIGDLEDENISLQKQVSALRSSQVEFEGLKHEVRQLREEAENARAAADETAALRRIAERQLAEALEALQAEREAKFAAKKELDAHLSREAQFNITNLAYSIRGMPEEGADDEVEAGASGGELVADHHADLFSEVHLHEISRLEKQLEQAHNENSQLSSALRAAQTSAETESAAAGVLRAGLARLLSRVAALHTLHGDCAPLEDDKVEGGVAARAAKWLTWWRVSGGELVALLAALKELDSPLADGSPAALQRAQLAQLSDRMADAEIRCAALQADADLLRTLAGGAGRALSSAAPALASAADTLAQLYHHVCAVNGTQPERLLLEHAGQNDVTDGSGRVDEEALALAAGELEGLRAAGLVARHADTLLDQLTHLRAALDTALDSRHRHQPEPPSYPFLRATNFLTNQMKRFKLINIDSINIERMESKRFHGYPPQANRDCQLVCNERSVKGITNFFENIARVHRNQSETKDECSDITRITPFLCKRAPFNVENKATSLPCDFNLHVAWRHSVLHGKNFYFKKANLAQNMKDSKNVFNVRESLRASVVAGITMLQYIM
ncbi:protein bicaudal D isoform X1 [Danaus plexippus]|uniref:protein bicaudal D isoform X1 n=1 Tax=Danaus plexippus TaxID=13037 RepID=UPI002AAFD745|nr:protein bicaudal D isoform X1 [Danaus plexippus]